MRTLLLLPIAYAAVRAQTQVAATAALLEDYCVTCHNAQARTAGLVLDPGELANLGAHAETWEKVVKKLRGNSMPPVGMPRPDAKAMIAFVRFLESGLDRAAAAEPQPGKLPAFASAPAASSARATATESCRTAQCSAVEPSASVEARSAAGFANARTAARSPRFTASINFESAAQATTTNEQIARNRIENIETIAASSIEPAKCTRKAASGAGNGVPTGLGNAQERTASRPILHRVRSPALYHEKIANELTNRIDRIHTDFLVVGAGVAGLRAAVALAAYGRVLVLAKDKLEESSSEWAQGGVAVALSDDDRVWLHEQDTLYAGDGLCDVAAVHTLVEEGPHDIEELIAWGAEFDKEGTKLAFGQEAAHSRRRILHAQGDSTGREIVRALYFKAANVENIDIRSFSGVTDLLQDEHGRVCGAMAWSEATSTAIEIHSRAVLLATGGMGRVFENTTNPDVATGDGVALAWRAGAVISDLEFVQFHPTALHVEGAPRFLLSEALRGEGAILKNSAGERFMPGYHEMAELAPRDVVSRSIVMEIFKSGSPHVFLDLSHREPGFVSKRFPRIYETCLQFGIDLEKQAAPVHPAAHYSMGGVKTDLEGRTSIPGLYAAGEAACVGVHGANRLASNSLLEGLVFGRRAGNTMGSAGLPTPGARQAIPVPRIPDVTEKELRGLAWRYCGIVREGGELRDVLAKLAAMGGQEIVKPRRAQFELRNLHTITTLIARCGLAREESRGGHYRSDFPEKRAEFQKHSLIDRSAHDVRFA